MTKAGFDLLYKEFKAISYLGHDYKSRLQTVIKNARDFNGSIENSFEFSGVQNPNPINDFELSELQDRVGKIDDKNNSKFSDIWSEVNGYLSRLELLGDKHDLWEKIS